MTPVRLGHLHEGVHCESKVICMNVLLVISGWYGLQKWSLDKSHAKLDLPSYSSMCYVHLARHIGKNRQKAEAPILHPFLVMSCVSNVMHQNNAHGRDCWATSFFLYANVMVQQAFDSSVEVSSSLVPLDSRLSVSYRWVSILEQHVFRERGKEIARIIHNHGNERISFHVRFCSPSAFSNPALSRNKITRETKISVLTSRVLIM